MERFAAVFLSMIATLLVALLIANGQLFVGILLGGLLVVAFFLMRAMRRRSEVSERG